MSVQLKGQIYGCRRDQVIDSTSLGKRLEKALKTHTEIFDELSKHGCKDCIAIIQRVIRDNRDSNGIGLDAHSTTNLGRLMGNE